MTIDPEDREDRDLRAWLAASTDPVVLGVERGELCESCANLGGVRKVNPIPPAEVTLYGLGSALGEIRSLCQACSEEYLRESARYWTQEVPTFATILRTQARTHGAVFVYGMICGTALMLLLRGLGLL